MRIEMLPYGQIATVYFTIFFPGGTQFASAPDWTPGGSNALITRNGTLDGLAAGTVYYVGSSMWMFPFSAAELQSKQTTVVIREEGTINDQSIVVQTYGHALSQHPNFGLTSFGSVGTVEHVIAGTIDLVDLVVAGTVDLVAVTAAVETGTVDLAAVAAIVQTGTVDLVAQLAAGTVGLVSSGTVDLVAAVAAVQSGTVDLVAEVAAVKAGTIDLVAQLAGGTVGLVQSGTVDLTAVAAAVESGTIDLVAQLAAGTVGLVSAGTIDLVAQLAAGTVGLVNAGTIDLVSSGTIDLVAQLAAGTVGLVSAGTIDLVAQLAAGTIDLIKAGTIDKVTLVSSGTIDLANAFAAAAITSVWNAGTKQQYQMKVFPAYDVNSDKFSVCAWLERDDAALDLTTATFKLYTYNGTLVYTGSSWNTGPTEIAALNSWFVEKTVATNIKGGTAYIVKTEMVYDGTTFTRLSGFGAAGTGT